MPFLNAGELPGEQKIHEIQFNFSTKTSTESGSAFGEEFPNMIFSVEMPEKSFKIQATDNGVGGYRWSETQDDFKLSQLTSKIGLEIEKYFGLQ